jgi:hypothetical protein
MAVFAFDQASLKSGCPLWFTAQPTVSQLARKLDWYLNFQIMKSECRKPQSITAELVKIENEWGIERADLSVGAQAAVLIPSHAYFPNKQTVILQFDGDGKGWAEAVQKTALGLREARIRVFLPDDLSSEEFKESWPRKTSAAIAEIELVERKAAP